MNQQVSNPLSGPHTHGKEDTPKIMRLVLLALTPATAFGIYQFGWPALFLWLITILSCIIFEAFSLWLARKPILSYIGDGSAILTGWLLAMTLPPWAPWWIGVLGGAIAIILGKQVFGGVGQNIFNPAMLARVALLISFPVQMTLWVNPLPMFSAMAPGFVDGLLITLKGFSIDAYSGASVMGHVKTEISNGATLTAALSQTYDNTALALGFVNGSLGETSALLILLGGLYLMRKKIISWHIPVAMIVSTALLATIMHSIDPEHYADALFHVMSGGLILGAFFIATDLVTSPNTKTGQLIFGAGCGLLVYVIRTWGGYPEGVAFAVMLMNAVVPLIDHYVRPRIYGHARSGKTLQYSEKKLARVQQAGED